MIVPVRKRHATRMVVGATHASSLPIYGIPQTYCRYSNYMVSVPNRVRWEQQMCHATTVYCMHVFAAYYAKPTSKKVRSVQYKTILSTICEIWNGVGTLAANHSILQKACLGFLPAWCLDLATVHGSRLLSRQVLQREVQPSKVEPGRT
jgi:hypothetical protein